MSKVLTIRVDEESYKILKLAAEAERRTISNYLEYAALNYTLNEMFISDDEMDEIKDLFPRLRKGLEDVKEGRWTLAE
ncbi:MAG: CopG family transcriptional regulator [Candidatus Kapabacteria bacterium]|nr:CopG family transcriptional regulator [Candidatus Kapabacteria bacterium]